MADDFDSNMEKIAGAIESDKELAGGLGLPGGDDFQPGPEVQSAPRQPGQAAMASASVGVGFLEIVSRGAFPHFTWEDADRELLTQRLAVVMDETGGGLPEWLLPYKSSIDLAVAAGFIVFKAVQAEAAHKAAIIDADGNPKAGANA